MGVYSLENEQRAKAWRELYYPSLSESLQEDPEIEARKEANTKSQNSWPEFFSENL